MSDAANEFACMTYAQVKPGDVLAGKYRVERVLGMGGMGVVVEAVHEVLHDRVALKFLLPNLLDNPDIVARFLREAQAAVRIKSPHVARVSDVGKLENGSPYMVMEFLEGNDLSHALDQQRVLEPKLACQYAMQVCEALAVAHAAGIIHRDIKPGNLFLTREADGSTIVKVLDFGISKVSDPSGQSKLTHTHTAIGSPTYMAPEQMRSSKDVDVRADIWSLGVVLYEMLAGKLPFDAESMPELIALVLESSAPGPRDVRPELPEELDQVVRKCLQKQREQRYDSVAALAADLAPFAGSAGPDHARKIARILSTEKTAPTSNPPPPIAPAAAGAAGQRSTGTAFGRTDPSQPTAAGGNRIPLYAALGGGVAVVALGTIWLALQGSSGQSGPASGSPATALESREIVAASAPALTTSAPPIRVEAAEASSADANAARPDASAAAPNATTPRVQPKAAPPASTRPPVKGKGDVFNDRQ